MTGIVTNQLINPRSIAVIGGSNNIHKPGGKLLKNLLDGSFSGQLYVVNPKEVEVQGLRSYQSAEDLPETDLAIMSIPAGLCLETVKILCDKKQTKAFIIISAGFGEESEEGKKLENEIGRYISSAGASLIGPNCIGVMTPYYQGVFTLPIPKLSPDGCDFVSGSGATAVFIMESGIPKGLKFASVFSVGNSSLLGVEDILEYLDNSFDIKTSSRIKLLYIENLQNPAKLLKHASSLIQKGCRIAAIKAGSSEAGSRAASSHTGAMASSDMAVEALFKKAGIVRCNGREELTTVASVFMHPVMRGKRMAIITHAGGPAVMLTDVLSAGGFTIPKLEGPVAEELLLKLFPGSSVANPIDILATGTAEQLGTVIDYCENKFDAIEGMVVIYGTPGLSEVYDAYEVLDEKMQHSGKPIFPVLPSITTAAGEVADFLSKGRINFPDEVLLGNALNKVYNTDTPAGTEKPAAINSGEIRTIIGHSPDGYLPENIIKSLFQASGIQGAGGGTARDIGALKKISEETGYPLVMKVVGPLHKSDVGGVSLNINSEEKLLQEFNRMQKIRDYQGVLIQPMLSGTELFIGASYEPKFGHLIFCGLGGIYVELIRDVACRLAPLSRPEAKDMLRSLKSYKIFQGARGQKGINEEEFIDILLKLSALLEIAPEIREIDMNPLIAKDDKFYAVDARIRIEK